MTEPIVVMKRYELKYLLDDQQTAFLTDRLRGHMTLDQYGRTAIASLYYDTPDCRLIRSSLEKPLFNYEHTDSFYWEIRMSCWGVSVISSQQLYHRMTIPMNNRKILEMMLSFPREERKVDGIHKRIMLAMNPKVVDAEVEIRNLYFHGYRIWMEKLFYWYRTAFYRPMRDKQK